MKTGLILKKIGIVLIIIALVSIFIFHKSNETRGREAYKNFQYSQAVQYLNKAVDQTSNKQKKIELYDMLAKSEIGYAMIMGNDRYPSPRAIDAYEKEWDLDNTNQRVLEDIVDLRMRANVTSYGTGETAISDFMGKTDKYLQIGLQKFPDSNVFISYDRQKKEAAEGMKEIFDAMMKEGK